MSGLHDLERRIDEKLRGMLRSSSPDQKRELLEIHRALLDDVTAHVDRLRRGKQAFPYTQLEVQILLPDPALQRSYKSSSSKQMLLRGTSTFALRISE